MEAEISIKSVIMAALLIGAFGLFFVRVRRLLAIMKAVQGRTEIKVDRLPQRLRVLVSDVLGQANVRRKFWPGLAHTLIFFGFLAVQPHSLELMITGVFPQLHFGPGIPGLYGAYLYVADILAFFVLIGLGYALYRRMLVRPRYLTNKLDAKMIIAFTAVIILSFHFINAFQSLMPVAADGFDYAAVLPVSTGFVTFFSLSKLSAAQVATGYEIAYWVHMLTILGFLVYIPGSKHLHLLAAVPNVFLKPLEREKAMITTDIEDEEAESFGLGTVAELNWKNVLDLYACTECGRCEEQCPAAATGKPLSPRQVVSDIKHDLFDQAAHLLTGDLQAVAPIMKEGSPVSQDVLWSCTTCRACEDICPVDIQHLDLILETRKNQVLMEAAFPPEMQETFTNLENQSNPWGFSADTRADWCKDLDVPLMTDNPEAEVLYFVGCAGAFDDRGKKIARSMARVLQRAGVDFAILGPEEGCNGDVARRAGNEYLAQMLIQTNVEVFNTYKPKKILSGCPHCFNMLKNEYPGFGAKYPVVHHTEYLFELLRQGRLTVNDTGFGKVTFHDSCYLGRWNGITEAPKELLTSMNKGVAPVMPERHGNQGFCCGAGGARMFMEETLGKRINNERTRELMETGAGVAAAACPFCVTMLTDGVTDAKGDMEVLDIAEIVDQATE